MGRIDEALAKGRALVETQRQGEVSAMLAGNVAFTAWFLAYLENDVGNRKGAEAALGEWRRLVARAVKDLPPDSFDRIAGMARIEVVGVTRLLADEDPQQARSAAQARLLRIEALKPATPGQERTRNFLLLNINRQIAVAEFRLGHYDTAEVTIRKAMRYLKLVPPRTLSDERDASDDQMLLAICLARLGRYEEARQSAEPALRFQRQLQSQANDDLSQRVQLAQALFATAVASGGRGYATLKEAAAYIDALPTPMRGLRSTMTLRRWIADEQRRS